MSVTLLSSKAVSCLREVLDNAIEERTICIKDLQTQSESEYVIVAPLNRVDCLNKTRSTYLPLMVI